MSTRWRIPDPEQLQRMAEIERQAKEQAARDRESKAGERKRKAARQRQMVAEFETARRARERGEWFATHSAPTREQLAALLREKAPTLAAVMEGKRK